MKSIYIGYFKPSEADIKDMWQESIFVFDTNVLLHLYRYSDETRDELLKIIDAFKDRIWIPRKVADESHYVFRSVGHDIHCGRVATLSGKL